MMRRRVLIHCCFLLGSGAAGAEPLLATSAEHHALHFDEETTKLHLEHTPEERQAWRPHSWLKHTVRNLDLDLDHQDLGIGFAFDIRKQKAFFDVGKNSSFGVSTDVRFHDGMATVKAKIRLPMSGVTKVLELPEVNLVPRTHKGSYYMEYHVPILSGNIDDVFRSLGAGDGPNGFRFF